MTTTSIAFRSQKTVLNLAYIPMKGPMLYLQQAGFIICILILQTKLIPFFHLEDWNCFYFG